MSLVNTVLRTTLAIALTCVVSSASAALVKTDWKNAGDNLAVLDSTTGVEWLNFSATKGMAYDNVVQLFDAGDQFAGWRVPTVVEVRDMVNILSTRGIYATGNAASWQKDIFTGAMGISGTPNGWYSAGWYQKDNGLVDVVGLLGNTFYNVGSVIVNHDTYRGTGYPDLSTWLVSDGGTTLSSLNDPTLNIANENAPINNVPLTGALTGLFLLGMYRSRKQ